MKKLLSVFLILGFVSTSAFASGELGEKKMVDCVESVQSARYEGGDVVEDTAQRPATENGSGTSR